MDPFVVFRAFGRDAQQVVESTRQQVAFGDVGRAADGFLERLHHRLALGLQGDLDEEIVAVAQRLGVEDGGVAADGPALLQRPHPAMNGGDGQPHLLAQLGGGGATVFLQGAQEGGVGSIHIFPLSGCLTHNIASRIGASGENRQEMPLVRG